MIGPAIQYHIELNGCTQYKLAARLIVGRAVVSTWCKKDSNPTWLTLNKIANALNIDVIDIVKTASKLKQNSEVVK